MLSHVAVRQRVSPSLCKFSFVNRDGVFRLERGADDYAHQPPCGYGTYVVLLNRDSDQAELVGI
jgi:hypothetical protein